MADKLKTKTELKDARGDGCFASDKIIKEGYKVGFMYREEPSDGFPDSGWRFLAGNEDDEYANDAKNVHIFKLSTIYNLDKDIIPYLNSEIGTVYVRVDSNKFELDSEEKEVFVEKQNK